MKFTRRNALGLITSTAAGAAFEPQAAAASGTTVNWLEGVPPAPTGVSWGVPWPRGTVAPDQPFGLASTDGSALPLQSWPLAWWPDGSLKFSGFATVTNSPGPLTLYSGPAALPYPVLHVTTVSDAISIDTGRLQCRIPIRGTALIESMTVEGRIVARDARLVCTLDDGAAFTGSIQQATVEQSGPVRAVVRLEGRHKADRGSREWLPFIVRVYFYAGLETVRVIHTIIFDGDEQKDFIRGLGLALTVPMREQVHNRHVRFATGEGGLWSEPVQPATGSRPLGQGLYARQLSGDRLPNKETFNAAGQKLLTDWAVWDDFRLVQPNADGFLIQKRTNPQSCWLQSAGGCRAAGLVFAGDVSGGLAVAIRNFWQSYPTSLEVRGAAGAAATIHAWLWSPDAPAMDLRHYDTRAHSLDSSYEDVQPGFSTPHGVARTSELTLFPSASVPVKAATVSQAAMAQSPPLLTASPRHIHSAGVFGIWSLPDRSTPARSQIEDQLDAAFAYYHKEVEQRHWYGFWDYGDVMHAYDGPRHVWRYDIGGYAWDNTELGTDMWLWYSFLRSGRADIFRMAEAMTRHTSEVDCYHLGRFAPLGSRHNVRHWGCGAKEPRISQAAYRRFYYYLTTDERTGDLMRGVIEVDRKTIEIDPMRLAAPLTSKLPYPGRVRGGPDWLAFVGNWMTAWERTNDPKYRDKILAGLDSIAQMPFGFLTGGPNQLYGYDPATGKLFVLDNGVGTYNLATIMGGAEVVFELNTLIDHPGWKTAWEQYCRLHSAPQTVVAQDNTTHSEGAEAQFARPGRLSGYLYLLTKNPAYARKAWSGIRRPRFATTHVAGPEVAARIDEAPFVSTNTTAQGCLETIEVLEMCPDYAPA